MGKLIDVDDLLITTIVTDDYSGNEVLEVATKEDIDSATPVDAIPKDQYEQRLKADMLDMLTEIQSEIDNLYFPQTYPEYMEGRNDCLEEIKELIQQKIDKLKGVEKEDV